MRISKFILKIVASLIVFILGCLLLNFIFIPYGTKSEIVWTDYHKQQSMDTIFVGTSLVQRIANTEVFDEELGCESFCMATPGQKMPESLLGIRSAYKDFGIKRVILGAELNTFIADEYLKPGAAFTSLKMQNESISDALSDLVYAYSYPQLWSSVDSINVLFPWIYNHVKANPSIIIENIKMKLSGTSLYEAAELNEKGWTYHGKGFGTYDETFKDLKNTPNLYLQRYSKVNITDDCLETAQDICDYCNENGIELVVVAIPQPVASILDYGSSYYDVYEQLQTFYESNGAVYIDFNLAKSNVFTNEDEYFSDWQHMNLLGSQKFCKVCADTIKAYEDGKDISKMFYSSWDAYLASIDYVAGAKLSTKVTDDGKIEMKGTALTGSNVKVEYKFSAYDEDAKKWVDIRGYSSDNKYTYDPGDVESVKVRVSIRKAGTNSTCDKYKGKTVFL